MSVDSEKHDEGNLADPAGKKPRRVFRWAVSVLVVVYLCSGFYVVRTDEIGIVRVFGKVASTMIEGRLVPKIVQPGLGYRLPYPLTRLNRVRLLETRTATIGFEQVDQLLGRDADPRRSEFLTGDQNIMQLRLAIQYTVDDPVAFLLGAVDPEALLKAEAESCLAHAVASVGVDELLGADRIRVGAAVRSQLERELRLHNPGVQVTAVSLQAPRPPAEVAEAFNDVQSAKAERHRLVLEAEAYRNRVVTTASGEADKMRREAEAYLGRRVAEAQGESKRFEDLYEKYRLAKQVTRMRLFMETMEEILPRMKQVFVDSEGEGGPIDLGLFDVKP